MRTLLLLLSVFLSALCAANESARDKVHFNYQMSCQGCHTPDGTGAKSVPQLKGHVGIFLQTQQGREYLVRVPGSALSALDNDELAGVLNWILIEFSGDSLAENYEPYTAVEVGRLRRNPLNELVLYRTKLLADITRRTGAKH